MGFGFDSIKKKKKKEIARWVPIERNSDFKRVESTSPVFFGFGNPERLIRRVYGVKLSTIQTSPVTRLFLPFVVRFQRFENWKRHERKIRGEGKSRGEKGERGGREREKERGIFVIRKSKLRPSRTIAVARVIFDLTLFPSLILTLVPPQLPVPNIFHGKLDFTPLCMRAILQWRSN